MIFRRTAREARQRFITTMCLLGAALIGQHYHEVGVWWIFVCFTIPLSIDGVVWWRSRHIARPQMLWQHDHTRPIGKLFSMDVKTDFEEEMRAKLRKGLDEELVKAFIGKSGPAWQGITTEENIPTGDNRKTHDIVMIDRLEDDHVIMEIECDGVVVTTRNFERGVLVGFPDLPQTWANAALAAHTPECQMRDDIKTKE